MLYPNVRTAEKPIEKQKLQKRYDSASKAAQADGCAAVFKAFETACGTSVAVFNCSIMRLLRQVAAGSEVWQTYHDIERLRLRLEPASNPDWQRSRPQAEIQLLGGDQNKNEIQYAALSIDTNGLANYGECCIELKETMISHRATCFEGNSALLFHNFKSFDNVLACNWADRSKLCAAKLQPQLKPTTKSAAFPSLLLKNGKDNIDDDFVEVHIFGSMTARTLASATLHPGTGRPKPKAFVDAIREKLIKSGVTVRS